MLDHGRKIKIMQFKQHEDGSCDIEFSWKERFILFKKGKIHLSGEGLRHFGNHLVKMVSDWNFKFNKKTQDLDTKDEDKIEGK